MRHIYLLFCFLFLSVYAVAQSRLPLLASAKPIDILLQKLRTDTKIDADSAARALADLNHYPAISIKGCNYLFYYHDERIGDIPLRVFIPPTYNNTKPNPAVMVLHGAVGISHFKDIDTLGNTDEDILVDPLKTQGYIIIQPIADKEKGFTWGGLRQSYNEGYSFNRTYSKLSRILTQLKRVLNIDDNRVYALGHSDGADGAIGLGVYKPDQFAAVVAYNTMFTNLFSRDYYIRNIQNLPLYEVHSDKDQLRRIAVNRQTIDSVKAFSSKITYKEYIGYEHYDKHLSIDEPNADKFMKAQLRNPYPTELYWETTEGSPYNSPAWLTISADTTQSSATWHKPFDVTYKYFIERNKAWFTYHIYNPMKSAAIKAAYHDNVFNLRTSGISAVDLKISPSMVDLKKPVTVIANGKQVFKGRVKTDKNFLLDNFVQTADRAAIWVNSINVKIN